LVELAAMVAILRVLVSFGILVLHFTTSMAFKLWTRELRNSANAAKNANLEGLYLGSDANSTEVGNAITMKLPMDSDNDGESIDR
jgi:hypothetical protein